MTYEQLLEIGARHGFVQWSRSRKIEKLSLEWVNVAGGRERMVYAAPVLPSYSKSHFICKATYLDCVEISLTSTVRLGDLFG